MGSIYREATLNIPSMTEGNFLSTLYRAGGTSPRRVLVIVEEEHPDGASRVAFDS